MRTLILVSAVALVAFSSSALAETPRQNPTAPSDPNQSFPVGFQDFAEIGDLDHTTYDRELNGGASNLVWINPCRGGCTFTVVNRGQDDAQNNETSIPAGEVPIGGRVTLSEFRFEQDTYDTAIECLREVWRPYDIEILTEEPAPGVIHHEAVLAGTATELGIQENSDQGQILGIAPSICTVRDNVPSFSFANAHPDNPIQLCWTLSHEIGHAFGLEHEFACEDPMTYLTQCGFRKFFRDAELPCGAFEQTPNCFCGGGKQTQNTHEWLLGVFGPGVGARAPELTLISPAADAVVDERYPILVDASDIRGIDRVEFYINDLLVSTVEESNGSSDTGYLFITSASQSDGVQNIEVRAYNDLELVTTATVRALKGSACTSTSECGVNEECSDGACTVLPPTIEDGGECTIDTQCLSGECTDSSQGSRCTTGCVPGIEGACADGFECLPTSEVDGVCWPTDTGGGCSVTGNSRAASLGAWMLGLALVIARRRRRR